MPLKIAVSPLADLSRAVSAFRPDHVVSLLTEGEWQGMRRPPLSLPRLQLAVLDTGPLPLDAESLARWEDCPLKPMSRRDVDELLCLGLRLGRKHPDREVRVLLHCHAGCSRSPAAALLLLAQEDGPGNEARSWERLMEACPQGVYPTGHILALGDRALGREGRLLGVWLEAMRGRGAVSGPVSPDEIRAAAAKAAPAKPAAPAGLLRPALVEERPFQGILRASFARA